MPHPGSTANGHESSPSRTTKHYAGCLLQNQESPHDIHHRQQGCYIPSGGSKKCMVIYFSRQPQEIFHPLPPCLGLCPAGRGGHVPFLIQKCLWWLGDLFKMYLGDTKAIQDKHLAALQSASANVIALIRTPPVGGPVEKT